jgi:hypothetical protein
VQSSDYELRGDAPPLMFLWLPDIDGIKFPEIQYGWAMSEHKLKLKTVITIAFLLHSYGLAIDVQDFADNKA